MMGDLLCGFARLVSGLSVRWQGCAPDDIQRIYYANHTSHFDFVALWAALPKDLRHKTRPVAARDYWERDRLRRFIAQKVIHAVLIERRHVALHDEQENPLQGMLEALDQGSSLILFPEGRRNVTEQMLPFKSGLYHLARKRPGIELVPVYLENLNRILPRGEFILIPLLGTATFGTPLKIGEGETKVEFIARAQRALEELKSP